MNIQKALTKEHSKQTVVKIVGYIGNNPKRFAELMAVFYGDDSRMSQRAAWSMSDIVLKNPELVRPYEKEMVDFLAQDKPDGILRNILRIFQDVDFSEEHSGLAFENAFNLMLNPKCAVAIRAFSISTVVRICQKYPELKNEVSEAIDIIMEDAERPAILVRCRKARKALAKMA